MATKEMQYSSMCDNTIDMFIGDPADIPLGWVISDGGIHNGIQTEDLRGIFLKGAPSTGRDLNIQNHTTAAPSNTVTVNSTSEHRHNIRFNTTTLSEGTHEHSFRSVNGLASLRCRGYNRSGLDTNGNWYGYIRSHGNINTMISQTVALQYDGTTNSSEHSHAVLKDTNTFATDDTGSEHTHNLTGGDGQTEPKHIKVIYITFVGF